MTLNIAHSAMPDSALHEPKGAAAAAIETTYVSDGAGSGSFILPKIQGQTAALEDTVPKKSVTGDVIWVDSGVKVINIFDATSFSTQNPSSLDVAIQVDLGPAINTTDVDLSASGTITINTEGMYALRFQGRLVRTGATGVAHLAARLTRNDTEILTPRSYILDDNNTSAMYIETLTSFFTVGEFVKLQLVRDSTLSGQNEGGFVTQSLTTSGWGNVPSVGVNVQRFYI